jgi:hypothetical protein
MNTQIVKTDKKKAVRKKTFVRKTAATQKKRSYRNTNNASGGRRKGAGRKLGAATKKTREIADKLAASGEETPLSYMLAVLRETPEKLKAQFKAGEIDEIEYAVLLKNLINRRDWAAEKAAPYIHPRLASIEANVDVKGQDFWQRELAREDAENHRNG